MKRALTSFERFIQVLAFALAGIGLLSMLVYLVLLWSKGYRVNTDVDPAVTGEVGDFVGGIAGSLFALAATLLFYLALTLQRREFQNSLTELQISSSALKATEEHHRSTLQVMREEKEFNVCLAAISVLKDEWKGSKGAHIGDIYAAWHARYGLASFFKPDCGQADYQIGQDRDRVPMPAFSIIRNYAERAAWIAQSIEAKTLSPDDRRYLCVIFEPLMRSFEETIPVAVDEVVRSFRTLLAEQQKQLSGWKVDVMRMSDHVDVHLLPLKASIQRARVKLNNVVESS